MIVDSTLINLTWLAIVFGMSKPSQTPAAAHGLSGIVAADTELSHLDGQEGRLIVAGEDIEQLASRLDFAGLAARLLAIVGQPAGDLGGPLVAARRAAFARLGALGDALRAPAAMDGLRAAMAHLPETSSNVDVLASVAVFAAAIARVQGGHPPIAPSDATHERDF